jgi:hypothetical protein
MRVPGPPLVAREDVAERLRVLRDPQRVREIRVLVGVQERLLDEQQEREPRQQRRAEDGRDRGRRPSGCGLCVNSR